MSNDTKPLIAVIIPVYGVEAYLKRCVESICNQTYSHIKIILVDDGSPDKCGEMCDEFAKEDDRIKVIHRENGGLSAARNSGLDAIFRGHIENECEFIIFIDSDDFALPCYIENLYTALKQADADVSVSWFIKYHEGDQIPQPACVNENDIQELNPKIFLERMFYQNMVETCAWGKLYKIELFSGIRYPEGALYEDLGTTYKLIDKCQKIAVIPNADVMYFQRGNSIQLMDFNINKMRCIDFAEDIVSFTNAKYPQIERAAICRLFSACCNIIFQIQDNEYEEQRERLWKLIRSYRANVLLNNRARSKARIAAFISYFGIQVMSKLYKIGNG